MADIVRITNNLFNVLWESGSIGVSGGNLADTNAIRTASPMPCESEKTYTFVPDVNSYESIWVNFYGLTNSRLRIDTSGGTFTTPQDCEQVRFRVTKTNIGVEPVQQYNAMFNVGGTALPYEPYRPHSLKKFDGTNWIDAAVKEWDGSQWQ